MKIITLEEHHDTKEMQDAVAIAISNLSPSRRVHYEQPAAFKAPVTLTQPILDFGSGRIAAMDKFGIDMQISGCGNAGMNLQLLSQEEALALSIDCNDKFAEAVKTYPTRLVGLSTLPTNNPREAADELNRCVNQLGFRGAMIPCATNGKFLDNPDFAPILQMANDLEVPLILHPTIVQSDVIEHYYSGIDSELDFLFAGPGYGWHFETGISVIRFILAGGFEKYPKLNLVIGHLGEMIPFYLERLDDLFCMARGKLQKPVSVYFKEHVFVTPSGMFHKNSFDFCVKTLGADKMMYSVDYPYLPPIILSKARPFLENADISNADKEKIGHGNAEKLFRI
jgi:hypothetical protein